MNGLTVCIRMWLRSLVGGAPGRTSRTMFRISTSESTIRGRTGNTESDSLMASKEFRRTAVVAPDLVLVVSSMRCPVAKTTTELLHHDSGPITLANGAGTNLSSEIGRGRGI